MTSILIVDDDIATVEVIRSSIDWNKLDINDVQTAFNVSGAKKILLEKKIDIVISDIEMPQESGLDLLKWVRNEGIECEFLLLTCHESFTYATNAMNFDAAAYLTKPFDIDIMELNLQKIVTKLHQKYSMKKRSEYGVSLEKNIRFIKQNFWKSVLEGELLNDSDIEGEIQNWHLNMKVDDKFCLIYSKLINLEADIERFGKGVLEYVLEGFHSEILTGKVENESVVKFYSSDTLCFIAICEVEEVGNLREKSEKLIEICKNYFKATVTCCISNAYPITELSNVRQKLKKGFDYNIASFGKTFLENEVEITANQDIQIIDLVKIVALVEQKDKVMILHYLKQLFDELASYKKLNLHSLYLMKQEIVQVVYTDLMKQGIQATKLFYDELSIKLSDHALDSTVDLVRWVNYLLEKTFAYEEEVAKAATLIDKINQYIHDHYTENISRNEIAGEFFLTPEYLAKLYKKKTGINIKDYINEYRIGKAKELLKAGEKNISMIAEMVGFDNFSYFSTLFKKVTGVSPKEYKDI